MSQQEYAHHVSAVWRATIILSIITIVEVVIALLYDKVLFVEGPRMPLNIFLISASIAKAFYIIAIFMHMKYEKKALQLTVLVPTLFLVWAIIAFLWEGYAWMSMRSIWSWF